MAKVLTAAATITCGPVATHGGAFTVVPKAKLTVAGQKVLTKVVVAAAKPLTPPPPPAPTPTWS